MCVDWSRGTGHWYIFFLEPLPFFILPRLISLLLDFFHFRPYLYHYIWRSSSLGAPISQNSYTSRHTHPAGLCDGLQPGIMYHKRSVLSLADKFILCTVACHNISLMPGSTSYSMLLTALPLKSLVNIQDSIFLVVSESALCSTQRKNNLVSRTKEHNEVSLFRCVKMLFWCDQAVQTHQRV